MSDKLTEMILKSLIKFLRDNLTGYSGIWLSSPDFEHDVETSATGTRTPRALPYVTVVHGSDEARPYEIGDRKRQRNVIWELWIASEDFVSMLRRPQQVEQLISTNVVSGVRGAIPLIDFDVGPSAVVGHFEVQTGEALPQIDAEDKNKWRNLKFLSIISCRAEEEKVAEAALIE